MVKLRHQKIEALMWIRISSILQYRFILFFFLNVFFIFNLLVFEPDSNLAWALSVKVDIEIYEANLKLDQNVIKERNKKNEINEWWGIRFIIELVYKWIKWGS